MRNKQEYRHVRTLHSFRFLLFTLMLILWVTGQTLHVSAQSAPDKPGFKIYVPFTAQTAFGPLWLKHLNEFRKQAELPIVAENPEWSTGNEYHSRYIVKNDVLAHDEDSGNPWYTPEGRAAAQSGNLMASGNLNTSDFKAIDSWIQAPFHALGILDPSLRTVGFGSYREEGATFQMGAGLDILRGQGPIPPNVRFPILWPSDGTTITIGTFINETPNPLTSCPGYSAPTGVPILIQIGSGNLSPNVGAHSIIQNGQSLENCVFSETTYTNPDKAYQEKGRRLLNGRDAVVMIPREPLSSFTTYTVTITINGQNYTWSFSTGNLNQANAPLEVVDFE